MSKGPEFMDETIQKLVKSLPNYPGNMGVAIQAEIAKQLIQMNEHLNNIAYWLESVVRK